MEENLVLIGDNIVRGVKTVAFKTFIIVNTSAHIIFTHPFIGLASTSI